ncbi:hypothetical protein ACHAPT_009418 [Fusarium lateritium]
MSDSSTTDMAFPFLRLPTEVQDKIVRYLLPAMILPETKEPVSRYDRRGSRGTLEPIEHETCGHLRNSCKQIRSLVDRLRPIRSTRGFHFDPKQDTLKVWEMKLPIAAPYHAPSPVPVRKLLTVFPHALNPWNKVSTGVSDPAWVDESLEDCSVGRHLETVEEMTLLIQSAGPEWRIDGFQMYGPHLPGPRRPWDSRFPPVFACIDKDPEPHFRARGIRDSTQYRWKGCHRNLFDSGVMRSIDPTGLTNQTPYIGFHGYSNGRFSMGGKWAGFRYYADTNNVEFSPLAFSEISFATDKQGTAEREPEGGCDAQFVARVWIIRPGRPAPPDEPHHCWVPVKMWEEDEPAWVRKVRNTWKMVSSMLSEYTEFEGDRDHGLFLENDKSI